MTDKVFVGLPDNDKTKIESIRVDATKKDCIKGLKYFMRFCNIQCYDALFFAYQCRWTLSIRSSYENVIDYAPLQNTFGYSGYQGYCLRIQLDCSKILN
jgi:hypothetical protein